jgi:hypothetical protein
LLGFVLLIITRFPTRGQEEAGGLEAEASGGGRSDILLISWAKDQWCN